MSVVWCPTQLASPLQGVSAHSRSTPSPSQRTRLHIAVCSAGPSAESTRAPIMSATASSLLSRVARSRRCRALQHRVVSHRLPTPGTGGEKEEEMAWHGEV